MIDIAVIIPVHNRIKTTKIGLKAIYDSVNFYKEKELNNDKKTLNIQIIVVDDGSTDGTGDWIKDNFQEVTILTGNGNLWWSGSINVALNYIIDKDVKYVLLWNDDIRPALNYFCVLHLWIYENKKEDTIVSSKVLWDDDSGQIFNVGCLFNPKTGKKTILGLGKYDDDMIYKKTRDIDWCGGMGVLIPKKIIDEVGFFDEITFPQYHGDADFMLRAKNKNKQIIVFPKLLIYNNRETTGTNNENLTMAIKSITKIGSNYNLKKDIEFYRRHSTSSFAYLELIKKYKIFFIGAIRNSLSKMFIYERNS